MNRYLASAQMDLKAANLPAEVMPTEIYMDYRTFDAVVSIPDSVRRYFFQIREFPREDENGNIKLKEYLALVRKYNLQNGIPNT